MAARRIWVGLDVGDTLTQICAIDAKDRVILETQVATDPEALLRSLQLSRCKVAKVALEAGELSIHLVRHLTEAGLDVDCYEARQMSRYLRVRVNKTDANDARGLAEIAKCGPNSLSRVHTKAAETQRIRSKLVFRHKVTWHRIASEALIRSLIRLNGGRLRSSRSAAAFERNVLDEIGRMQVELGVDLHEDVVPLLRLTMDLKSYLSSLDANMKRLAKKHPVCSRLMRVPGVGPITAISFYTAIDDPHRIKQASAVGAYLGLTPLVHQSGKMLKHRRISKRGNKLTRSHLTLGANAILNFGNESPLKAWGQAVAERAGPGKARIALARKLAVIMLAIWKSGKAYDPDFAETRAREKMVSFGPSAPGAQRAPEADEMAESGPIREAD